MARTRKTPPPAAKAPLRLHEWFELFDLSDQEVASRLGVTPPTVNRWINGERQVKPHVQARIATMLGISPEALWRSPTPEDIAGIISRSVADPAGPKSLPPEIISHILKRH
ncbi:MAG: helix-turn-helix domain-containing protein [Nitrobacter sp.]|uniref:helix-turn-helix domain-containing protein n=1 Tax=Nitrobacter sp. TaxID=29420 RepID=UPI00342EB801|nr:helix-turn-helix domain-containing protein [Nitrobacter sp.]